MLESLITIQGFTKSDMPILEIYNIENSLVGGIYGILTRIFLVNQFHLENNASKFVFIFYVVAERKRVRVIDAQVESNIFLNANW